MVQALPDSRNSHIATGRQPWVFLCPPPRVLTRGKPAALRRKVVSFLKLGLSAAVSRFRTTPHAEFSFF